MTGRHRAARGRPPIGWVTVVCVLAAVSVVMSGVKPPGAVSLDIRAQGAGLLRVATTSLVAMSSLVCPGLALRVRWRRCAGLPLGLVPLPGLALLLAVGGGCWATARHVDPHYTSGIAVFAALAACAAASWRAGPLLERDERRVLMLAGLVFLFALGRSLWSQSPDGELFTATISRTLEVGDRPDSRISYHVATLVGHGLSPYGAVGAGLFEPYTFLDRGPLPGVASAAVMLAVGTTPAASLPDQSWSIYDAEGFMAYRIVMFLLALMVLPALYSLTRSLAGPARAHLAVVAAASTPFVVHEVYFTWPKLAATAFALMAAHAIVNRRFVAGGLLAGIGSLMHPLALLTVPTLGLLIVLVAGGRGFRAGPRRISGAALRANASLGLGLATVVGAWRLINFGRPAPGDFVGYVLDADAHDASSLMDWLSSRATSVANTLIPLYRLSDPGDPSINSIYAQSGNVVHFFFQYWTGLPFGVGIVFFLPLLVGIFRAGRETPWVVVSLVVLPFVGFAVYWGSYDSGLLREGLHPWVLTLIVIWALTWPTPPGRRRLGLAIRSVLALRMVELLAWAVLPAWTSSRTLVMPERALADAVALAAMVGAAGAIAMVALLGTAPMIATRVDVSRAAAHP